MLFKSANPLLLFKGGKFEGRFKGGKLRFGRFSPAILLGIVVLIVVGVLVESPEPIVELVVVVLPKLSRLGKLSGGNPGI